MKKRSFAVCYPELAAQWHSEKNGNETPDRISPRSRKRIWWKCAKGSDHEWETTPGRRAGGEGCPFCAGKRFSLTHSLALTYPQLISSWHPTKNGELTPEKVVAKDKNRFWWQCPEDRYHEWQARISDRFLGPSCPICNQEDFKYTSTLHYHLKKEWHPTRNGDLTPDRVTPGSRRKVWWKCHEGPDHEWEADLFSRTKGAKCPFCMGRKLSVTNTFAARFPEMAREWHPTLNGALRPNQVMAGHSQKVWWQCSQEPEHVWEATPGTRSRRSKCPLCSKPEEHRSPSLSTRSPELAREFHPTKNGPLTPDKVQPESTVQVWWQCSVNGDHVWKTNAAARFVGQEGCPKCARKKNKKTA